MRKRAFFIFMAVICALVAAAVSYIQSAHFAGVVKGLLAKRIPQDMGIEGDFSEFQIRLFPPGVSLTNPSLRVLKGNVVDLPPGAWVKARRLDLLFRPFQMLSGNIRIHQVTIVGGDVQVDFDKSSFKKKPSSKSKPRIGLHWDELFQIHAEAISLEDTRLRFSSEEPRIKGELTAREFYLGQWSGSGGLGYEAVIDLREIQGEMPAIWKNPKRLEQVRASLRVNAGGMRVTDLSAVHDGIEVKSTAFIKGNLLKQEALMADGSLSLSGELGKIVELISPKKVAELPEGRVSFSGKVKGDLADLENTIRAEGMLNAAGVRFGHWVADQVSVQGGYRAQSGSREITVEKALIQSAEVERSGGDRPGSGGKIEILPFQYRIGSAQPLEVGVNFTRAHVHWLGAPALKDVFPLDFRVSGPLKARYEAGKNWELQSSVDFKMDRFQLTNQRLGKSKPLKKILDIKDLALKGGIRVTPQGLFPKDLQMILPRTRLAIGGKVDFKSGYELTSTGNVDLSDVGQIAENDVRGVGTLSTRVHGPAARVFLDFDANLKDAYYLHLRLGDFKGVVTWDDDPGHLIFRNIQLRQGLTSYSANGALDLGKADTADLEVKVLRGGVGDFMSIFDDFTEKLWWFPRSLRGQIDGNIKVSGGIGLDQISIVGDLSGQNLQFFEEKFKSVSLRGGFVKRRYVIDSFQAQKRQGSMGGRISYDSRDERFDWQFRTEGFAVSDLDHVARLDVPVRGRLGISSTGQGRSGEVDSSTLISLGEMSIRGLPIRPSDLAIKTSRGGVSAKGSIFGGQGYLDAFYDFRPGTASLIKGEFRNFDFSPILLLLNPRMIQDSQLAGMISGDVDLSFKSGEFEKASGTLALSDYLLAKTGTRFQLVQPVSLKVDHGTFDLPNLAIRSNKGQVGLKLSGRNAVLSGVISGGLDVSLMEFLTPSIEQSSGIATVSGEISGTLKAPVVVGKASFKGLGIKADSLEAPFENVSGVAVLKQNIVTLQGIEADLANGKVVAGGSIELLPDRYPKIDLKANIAGSKLKIYPLQYAKIRGNLAVKGESLPYSVTGAVFVESALLREGVLNRSQGQGQSFKSARYTPQTGSSRESDVSSFKLAIDVTADSGVMIQNDLFDAEARGQLTLVNTLASPRVLGDVSLISGNMTFKDRVFQIQSAAVDFDNPAVINPKFNLTANTEVNSVKIQMYVAGRLDSYKIDLTSTPSMPESEILSLLAVGLTSDDARKLRATDRGAIEQSEAASILLNSMDFNRDVRNKTGFQIQVDEAVNNQSGASAFRPRTENESAAAPKIVIKRQVGKRLELSFGSTVGVGTTSQREVNAEVKVTPGFSVIGVWDTLEGVVAQENKTSTSYGVDLKLQKRFK